MADVNAAPAAVSNGVDPAGNSAGEAAAAAAAALSHTNSTAANGDARTPEASLTNGDGNVAQQEGRSADSQPAAGATTENGTTPAEAIELDTRPAVLIIGGLGYVGRYLANYVHTHQLASTIRLVDKQLPQLAALAPEFKEACSDANFMQADASREQSQDRIFDLPPGPDGTKRQFDYVFNCGGETRYSQEDEVYKLRSYQLSLAIGREAAKRGVKAYVECSTGTVYNPNKTPVKETDKTTKPHTKQAKWKLQAEEELAKIAGLRLVILRFPNIYGAYGGGWLGTQLALARVYQSRGKETMKWLWNGELRTNTLHVEDAARACWLAAEWRSRNDSIPGTAGDSRGMSVFNVVDKGQTKQGTMAQIIKEVFHIETGFQNALVNTFARLNLEHVVDDVNDDTLDDWADLQDAAGLPNKGGPLSPFMEKEVLRDADLSIDGSRFESVVGFRPQHERITKAEVEAVIESYKTMGWWP